MDFKKWVNNFYSINETSQFHTWLVEATTNSRYSVEVNYRTKTKEVAEGFAKICLGYVSAAMKQDGYHVKQVYEQEPIRILVSTRNYDDGEWIGIVSFNPNHDGGCFIISKGFYNKDRKTVSIQSNQKCKGDSSAEITAELREIMHKLKETPDNHKDKLKGLNLKRGPKR